MTPGAGATLAELGEFRLISALIGDLPADPAVLLGPGDDAAVLRVDGAVVVSTDVFVEGVHFRRDWSAAADVGHKTVAASVADIEAMGARPTAVVIGFSAPGELPVRWALDFAAGLRAECVAAGVSLVGGDVTRAAEVHIAATVLGSLDGRAPVRRSGARPGDVVAVRGRLGWAAAGLVVLKRGFRSPRSAVQAQRIPEVPYGAGAAAARAGATAMIDVSDGLLADLGHIARASGVRCDVRRDAFTIDEPLQVVAAVTGSDPYQLLLTGGEDHALVATFPHTAPDGWMPIGRVQAAGEDGPGVLVDGEPWTAAAGWDHFRAGRRR